jgi:cob(I)alamin adenosyltransferase
MALSGGLPKVFGASIIRIQGELFQLGAELATPHDKKVATRLVEISAITAMENEIDAMEAKLTPLKTFILPGGAPASSILHFARTVSRRAERELVTLARHEIIRHEVLQYMNRLSDYLFVCARFANHDAKVEDIPWVAPH